jgi:hypothetical protein
LIFENKSAVQKGRLLRGRGLKVCSYNESREDKGRQTKKDVGGGEKGQTSPHKFCKQSIRVESWFILHLEKNLRFVGFFDSTLKTFFVNASLA